MHEIFLQNNYEYARTFIRRIINISTNGPEKAYKNNCSKFLIDNDSKAHRNF